MRPYEKEIQSIKNQIIQKYKPEDIYLFGSCARGIITKRSDIDICVIIATDNKRKLIQQMLIELDYTVDIDIIVYTPEEWKKYKNDPSTFAYLIKSKGVSLLG
ncbi:DNA polymerase sigma [Thermoanaerobacter kivui]|uniref:DNA polymerase sigma n=2 Tax=Thermoanaerobacter TaxID=1754 RepID=I8R1S7_9THEO|nr:MULTISPECIES: nucleotidyltransferase domain-containing protein [Thermoanaerobacter]HHY80553.1 nucleotidyltransferase domain-containing protein [Thermoanaerobacter sp.]AIS51441.1 DNA polymerase sigma [Thermoanaerobacter kivui]EIV99329.1 DNA polymerase sigma [Thermoanaerobacter siderophilus SR4]KHO61335.1 nucleotidyltransferase [Thermoanaerobacter sp. YS13]UZQ83269.1 nucleotidyltransferase domain-containing protein [Thermoanaerobacter sp. RKWS2]